MPASSWITSISRDITVHSVLHAAWWQETASLLHHDLSFGRCSFGNSKPLGISVWNADYFGYYENRDISFSCSSEHSSTTNHWFGGTIPV